MARQTKPVLMPEELWWASWILAGLGALVAGVLATRSGPGLDFSPSFNRHAVPAAQALVGVLAAAAPALTLSLLLRRGRIRFEYGARPPRYHSLDFSGHTQAAPLRRAHAQYPASDGELRDYHVLAALGAVLICLAPAVPFLCEFLSGAHGPSVAVSTYLATVRYIGSWTAWPGLAVASAGAALWLAAVHRFLRRLNADG